MNKYRPLPDSTKSILEFNEWIMWSIGVDSEDFEIDYYAQYKNLRHWCVDLIVAKGISYTDIPLVTSENQNEIFKKARKELNLKKFKSINTHEFYIENIGGLITPVTRSKT